MSTVESKSPKASSPAKSGSPAKSEGGSPKSGKSPEASGTQGLPGILPAEFWRDLAETRGDADAASNYSDNGSTTASLSSSIIQYRTIHGRRYHSERGNAEYWGANDDQANEALDIIHHVLTLLLDGKSHLAPLDDNIKKVVDIGTGTGIWAIDFADEHPDIEVVGTDISPTQPSWVPPNLQFQIDDCTQDWTFAENSIDYVHIRWLFGSIQDWDALYRQAYKCLKPGGWIESHEPSVMFESDDGSIHEHSALGQWGKFFVEGGKKMGRSTTVVEDEIQKKGIEAAGFVDIQEANFKNSVGGWAKDPKQNEMGRFQRMAVEGDTEGTIGYMAMLTGWSREEVAVYIAHFRREIRDNSMHGYFRQKVVWARKPMPSTTEA